MKIFKRSIPAAVTLQLTVITALLTLNSGCVRQEKPTQDPEVKISDIKEIFNTPVAKPSQMDPNAVEIRVNGSDITTGAVINQANIIAATQGRGMSKEQLMQNRDRIIAQARDALILQSLLNTAVTEENIKISDEEWAAQEESLKKTLPEGSTLQAELEKSNVTYEDFKASQISRMQVDKLVKSKIPAVEDPTEADAKKYYDEHPAQFRFPESISFQMLSISQPKTDSDEERKKKLDAAEVIRKELVEGASMDEKVAAHSEHPSKDNGGKVRILKGSTGIQELESILFNLKMGNYSDVIVLPNGYMIYKALEAHPAGMTPLEEVKARILAAIKQNKQKTAVSEYIKQLRDKADIEFVGKEKPTAPEGAPAKTPTPEK